MPQLADTPEAIVAVPPLTTQAVLVGPGTVEGFQSAAVDQVPNDAIQE